MPPCFSSMACPRQDRATAFGVAHGKSCLCPFPKWHISALLHLGCLLSLPPPLVHHSPIDALDSASGPRVPASPPCPSPRSGMWAPRHRLPAVVDWLATSPGLDSDARVWIVHAHFVTNPSRDFPLVLTDGSGLENKS